MSSSQPVAAPNSASRNRLLLVVYTAAIFTSALLLFSVQPLFTKMVLPRLGGSPAVWSVAMVFFQSLLLGGYAYAHYLMQLRSTSHYNDFFRITRNYEYAWYGNFPVDEEAWHIIKTDFEKFDTSLPRK